MLSVKFNFPSTGQIDKKLVLGGALFGAGWGLAGACPGPALVSFMANANSITGVWVAAFFAGVVAASERKQKV
jgi:uncharacterized protein